MASGRPRYSDQRLPVSPRAGAAQNGRHPNWGHPDHDACGTGFVARLGGSANYDIIQYALTALERLTHRGGVDADGASGDGAGLLTSIPEAFFRTRAHEQGITLPEVFGLGFGFFPPGSAGGARSAASGQQQFAWAPGGGDDAGDLAVFRGAISSGAGNGAV